MPFHRQIGTIQLQQESVLDDGFVFHAQRLAERLEVGDFARIMVVAQRRGDNTR